MFPHVKVPNSLDLKTAIIRKPLVVSPDTTVVDAIAQMSGMRSTCNTTKAEIYHLDDLYLESRSSCVIVMEDGQVAGILTERDIVRLSAQQKFLDCLTMRQVMAHPVVTLRESAFTDLFSAIYLLQQHHIHHLPILDDQNELLGFITYDSLQHLAQPIGLLRLRQVAEVMTRNVVCAVPDSSVLAIAQHMSHHNISSVVIVKSGDDHAEVRSIPVGILTERDLVQCQALGLDLEVCTAEAVMSTPMFSVTPEESLWTVQQVMEQRLIRRVAVTGEQGELLGIVTRTDLLQALNPLELYKLAEGLEFQVVQLEAEKVQLLENRTAELERQVEARTAALTINAQREKLVAQIATSIRNSLNLQEILKVCVAEVRAFLECDRVLVYQFQPDWSGLIIAESMVEGCSSALGNQIHDSCFQSQTATFYNSDQPIIANDIYTAGYADCHIHLLERYQVQANLVVPIRVSGQLWGLLIGHQCVEPHEWRAEDTLLLQDIAVQLAIALQQATLHQQLQEELEARRQAEARLRESEQRYATLVAAAPVGIFRLDAVGNYTYVNDRWCQITGRTAEPVLGETWWQGVSSDDCNRVVAEWHHSIQENRLFQIEYRLQPLDGSVTWVYGQVVTEWDATGQPKGYVGTITDISDRVRSEEALQTSEAHQRALISAIPDLIMRVNREGIYLEFVTTPTFPVLGNLVEIVGTHVSQTLPPDLAQKRLDHIHLALQTGSIQIYEQDLSIGDTVQVEEVRVVPYSGDEVLLLVRDISDRKQAELALQHSEAKSRAILRAIPDLLFRVGADGRYREFVSQYQDFAVMPPDVDIAGRLLAELLPKEHVERHLHYLQKALQTGELQVYEHILPVGDRLQDEEVRVVKSDEDEVLFMIRNISDRKRAERQLQNLIEGTAATTGQNFFPALVQHMAEALGVSYALVSEQIDDTLHILAFWANGSLQPVFSYSAEGTPCDTVVRNGKFYCHSHLCDLFPDNSRLVEMGAESCLGIALYDTQGKAIGSLCVLDQQPVRDLQRAENLLRVFAARAAAELERERATQALERLNQDLEQKVKARTAALQASEERWQFILRGSNDGIWDWDVTTNCVFYSSRWKAMRGLTDDEVGDSRQEWAKGIHPEDYDRVMAAVEKHFAHKTEFFEMEYRVRRKDGSYIWILDRGQALWDKSGQVIRMSGSETDITIRKQIEEALWESERRYASLAMVAPVAIFRFDEPLNCTYVSDRWSEMTGRPIRSAIGRGWMEALHPEDRDPLVAQWTKDFAYMPSRNEVFHQGEGRHLRPDGSVNWFYVQVVPEFDLDGNIIGYIGTLTDITKRKQAENTVCQQAEQETLIREITQRIRRSLNLQTIFNTACQEVRQVIQADRVGIFKFYPESHFDDGEFVAESVVEGYSSVVAIRVHDHCFGESYSSLYANGRFFVVDDIYNNGLTTCHSDILAQFEVRATLIAPLLCGEQLWGLLCVHQCATTRHWQPSEIGFTQQIANQLAIAIQQASLYEQLQQELAERQQAQQQLTERNQQLAVSNEDLARATRLKDEFLANMSHELRTPLNAILGMTEGLQEQVFGQITEQQFRALQIIERSSSHLLELINDILDVAKIESGQIELDVAPTAIAPLCQSSLTFIKQQALKKRIQLDLKLPPNLPDLWVDERRIRQVLINLLNNAVKFTPAGGQIRVEISRHRQLTVRDLLLSGDRVKVEQTALGHQSNLAVALTPQPEDLWIRDYLQISVIDTGIGIASEHMDKLFQPFVQIDSALNRQYAGTGLGLALVKRIVELHGGQVGVTSEVGVGSCFTINLPCATSAPFSPTLEPSVDGDGDFSSSEQETVSPLILLTEDNEANIMTLSSYLKAKGYRLLIAKNGQESIALTRSERPDLILMDIQMPGMDGLEAIQQIRRDPDSVEIPIIALTALAMTGDRDRCLAAGANEYLSKPVKLRELVTLIQHLLTQNP